jgi:hypothetical protein
MQNSHIIIMHCLFITQSRFNGWIADTNVVFEREGFPIRLSNLTTVWTMIYTQPGRYNVTLTASNATATSSTTLIWTIAAPGSGVRSSRRTSTSRTWPNRSPPPR